MESEKMRIKDNNNKEEIENLFFNLFKKLSR